MSVLDTCRCVGSLCHCTGRSIAKDGSWVSIPLMMKDASISGEKHLTADATMSIADRAALPMYDAVRGQWIEGKPAEVFYATLDAIEALPEMQRATAHRDAAREKMLSDTYAAGRAA